MKKKNLVCFESGGPKKDTPFSDDKEDIGMTAMKELNTTTNTSANKKEVQEEVQEEKEPEMEEKKSEKKNDEKKDKKSARANSSSHEFFLFADKYPENYECLKEYYGLDDVKKTQFFNFNFLVFENKTFHKSRSSKENLFPK